MHNKQAQIPPAADSAAEKPPSADQSAMRKDLRFQAEPGTKEDVSMIPAGTDSSDDLVLQAVEDALPPAIAGLVIHLLYALTAVSSKVSPVLVSTSLAATTVLGFLYWSVRNKRFSPEQANLLGAGVAVVVMLHVTVYALVGGESSQVLVVVLLLYMIGRTFQSLHWVGALNVSIFAVWGCVCWVTFPVSVSFSLMIAAMAVAVLSVTEFCNRQLKLRRLEGEREQRGAHREADEQERKKSEERNKLAIEGANEGHWYWDLEADKVYFSPSWCSTLGFQEKDFTNNPDEWFKRVHPYHLPELKQSLAAHLYGRTEYFHSQHRILHRDGSYIWVMARGLALRDAEGNPTAIAGGQLDMTDLITGEKSMVNDAFRDQLTGLPNREACMIRLQKCMEHYREDRSRLFAVLFLDLDRFKFVNDSFGHLVGDQLLAAAASRIKNCLRQNRSDMVARFGGDEFVVLVEELKQRDDVIKVAERIRDALRGPFKLGRDEVVTGTSIGVVYSDCGVEKTDDLLRNADTAMYQAKAQGTGQIQVFTTEMRKEVVRSYQLSNELGKVLNRGDLLLHYQPIFSMETGKISRAEALLRWRRQNGELVGPTEFIPLAEETGLIDDIGAWALRTACSQNLAWQQAGLPAIRVAVNLSGHQLREATFPEKVIQMLAELGLDHQWLEFELTESALMDERASRGGGQAKALHRLSEKGIYMSIDDFGIGHSSLSHLRRFPFSTLKMDRSFVAGLCSESKSQAVARGLIRLAHSLGLHVVAEGVESLKQLAFLRREECDYIQGFLASRPVSAEKLQQLLASDFNVLSQLGLEDSDGALRSAPMQKAGVKEFEQRVAGRFLIQ